MIEKRKVGRPKKQLENYDSYEKKGIVKVPEDSDNILELKCPYPHQFKIMSSYFKQSKIDLIYMQFSKDKVIFFAQGKAKKNKILVYFNSNELIKYYIEYEKPLTIIINQDILDKVLNNADKMFSSVEFQIRFDSERKINIILYDKSFNKEGTYNIPYSNADEETELTINFYKKFQDTITTNYLFTYTYLDKQFKKTISDLKTTSNNIEISLHQSMPLSITCSDGKQIVYTERYKNSNKIQLKHTLNNNEMVQVKLNLDLLKAISSSAVSTNHTIYCDKDNSEIMVQSTLENNIITLYTFILKDT